MIAVLIGLVSAAIGLGALWLRRALGEAEARGARNAIGELGAQVHRAERRADAAEARAEAAHRDRLEAITARSAQPPASDADELREALEGPGEDVRRAIEGRRGR